MDATSTTVLAQHNHGYDRLMRLLGGMWFWFLALCMVAVVRERLFTAASLHDLSPSVVSSFCLAIFYVILGVLMVLRPEAKAQARGMAPQVAAIVGTYLPWCVSFLPHNNHPALDMLSSACLIVGTVMMLVTIRHLGRSFSLVAQARSVVQTGPYRWIRHPLYLAEEIAIIGAMLQFLSPLTVLILVVHMAVQVWRIRYEEDVLRRTCRDYATYEASRWRLIPYVW